MEFLLQQGADATLKNDSGETADEGAAKRSRPDLATLIKNQAASQLAAIAKAKAQAEEEQK